MVIGFEGSEWRQRSPTPSDQSIKEPQSRELARAEAQKAGPEVLEGAEMPQRQGFLLGSTRPSLRSHIRVCEPVRKPPA